MRSQTGEWASPEEAASPCCEFAGFVCCSQGWNSRNLGWALRRKKVVFLGNRETPLFCPCLGFSELSWHEMHDGNSLDFNANLL